MIINKKALLTAAPITSMATEKLRAHETSYGLVEAGYDIRIKQDIHFTGNGVKFPIVTSLHGFEKQHERGNFILASSVEEFNMPTWLVGTVYDKSSWARKGLSVFNTVIEPGWMGYLTLELVYHGRAPLTIKAGSGIAQVLFNCIKEDASYGDGKYQNQPDRPIQAL